MEILDLFDLLKEFINSRNAKKEEEFKIYIDDIFNKTEIVLKNYIDMFSAIRINIISGKYNINDIIQYLWAREYEVKEVRVFLRSFLEDKYYQNDETRVKFVAAIYGIMECYPVSNNTIVDKSKHTIKSYIKFCRGLLIENEETQKQKIIKMTDGVLKDLTTSWKTVCDCYRELKR